jgi:hypothetical protein
LLQSIDRERVALSTDPVPAAVPVAPAVVSENRTALPVIVGDPARADYQPYWSPR